MNQVQCIGRLAREVTLTQIGEDKQVVRNAIAINHQKRNGEKQVDFIPIIAWNAKAQLIADYLNKGDEIGIVGQLHSHQYENKLGQLIQTVEITIVEVTFLRKKQENPLSFEALVGEEK